MSSKTLVLILVALVVGGLLGANLPHIGGHSAGLKLSDAGSGPCAGGAAAQYWVAPMDANFRRDEPGKSPMGMDLIPVCDSPASGDADVRISPQVLQNLGVRTASVEHKLIQRPVTAVGVVAYDESSLQMIHARAEGWIEQLGVESEGAAVKAGDELYALFSPKLVAAVAEYRAAQKSGRNLLVDAAVGRLTALGYSKDQVRALARNASQGDRLIQNVARDSVVTMLGVRHGQFVKPGTHIMTLATLDRVWILADVLERDAALIRVGQSARASLSGAPTGDALGQEWLGQVDYIYPALDARTRTLKVRLAFDNADGALKPNMFTQVVIATEAGEAGLSMPASALIRSGRGDRVVVALGDGEFRIVPITVGHQSDGQVEVKVGLDAGTQVVIDGQFLIDSEANVDAEARRLEAPRPMVSPQSDADMSDGTHADHSHMGHDMPMNMPMNAHADHNMDEHSAEPQFTRGKVLAVDKEAGLVTLDHEFIKSIGMPAMAMDFKIATGLAMDKLKAGDTVRFVVAYQDGGMRITQLEILP